MTDTQSVEMGYIEAVKAVAAAYDAGERAGELRALHSAATTPGDGEICWRMARVREAFSMGEGEAVVLDICAARLFAFRPLPSGKALSDMFRRAGAEPGERSAAFSGEGGSLSAMVCDFLLGHAPRLPEGVELELCAELPPVFHGVELIDDICEFLAASFDSELFPASVLLTGGRGFGKKEIFRNVALRRGNTLLTVSAADVDTDELITAAALYDSLVCVTGAGSFRRGALLELAMGCGLLLMTERDPAFAPELGGACLVRAVPEITAEERLAAMRLWMDAGEDEEWRTAARFFRMTPGQLRTAAERCAAEDMLCGGASAQEKLAVLRDVNSLAFAGNAELLLTNKRLSDLVLPPAQTRQINDICSFARAKYKVFEDLGFSEKIAYGRGISALFYGASGTGKTLAACAIANELGMRLYRADISQLISKYVGETQKNLGKVFDSAQNSGCILFFDEADALFSRRSDAGDSQDKYSNAEVAYLLQRIEQYDGLILMATNLMQNFDEAFRRRIGYMVYFPLPDAEQRQKMWENAFPQAAPARGLDFRLLAESLELSGAGVKNTAVNAAYMAAADGGEITMAVVADAARLEYGKQGKAFPQKFGMMFPSERSCSK